MECQPSGADRVFAHAAGFFTGAFHPPRQFNWIVGLGLFSLVLVANFTGYLLPYDQLAYWAVTVPTGIHSVKLVKEGNDLCLQCHRVHEYDTVEHHFHKKKGEKGEPIRSAEGEVLFDVGTGSECAQCHMPGRARVHYNLGLLLQYLRQDAEAEAVLIKAMELDTDNLDYLYALADHYMKRGKLHKAKGIAEKMVAKQPGQRIGHELLEVIEKKLP